MGLLDIFRRKSQQPIENTQVEPKREPYDIDYSFTKDDQIQVEFKDHYYNSYNGITYNITRLVVDDNHVNIDGREICPCHVSWYSTTDTVYFDKTTGETVNPRSTSYKDILTEIDLNLLQTDKEYCKIVMKDLLNREKVEELLKMGLQEMPALYCGNYVGGVRKTEEGYRKFFSKSVGMAVHNSDLFVNRRKEIEEERKMREELYMN